MSKIVLNHSAEAILENLREGHRLVTRMLPRDTFGPHVLLANGKPVRKVAASVLQGLLQTNRVVPVKPNPGESHFLRCYALAPSKTVTED